MHRNTRSIAALALAAIIGRGRSLDKTLAETTQSLTDKRARAYVQELVYGVLRWYWRLKPQLGLLLKRPLRDRDRDIEMLLLVGLYQQQFLATATHAAVSETVAACHELHKPWARGLVNGTLRNALRESDRLAAAGNATRAGETSHPDWLIAALTADWPEAAPGLLAANNERPPLTLRVNARQSTRDAYRAELDAAFGDQPGHPQALRPGVAEVETAGDAALEDVEVGCQGYVRLHDVQVVHPGRVDRRQRPRQEIGMLLIVAFDADAVARPQHRLQQLRRPFARHHLAVGDRRGGGQPLALVARQPVPDPGLQTSPVHGPAPS